MKYDDIEPDIDPDLAPDIDLRPSKEEPQFIFPGDTEPDRRSRSVPTVIAILLIAAVAGTGYFVFRQRGAPSGTPASSTPAPLKGTLAPEPLGADAEQVTIPPLDESDEAVRELVRALSSHPTVAAWLATDDLIRQFTVVVSNIANGEPAAKQAAAIRPRGSFQIEERGEDVFVASKGSSRYLPLATAVTSVDPAGAARLYATLKPRIEEAYRELGYPDTPFDQTLEKALVLLLNTPVPAGRLPLQPAGGTSYRFADRALETLTPSQKALIRMGPENQRAVQDALRRLAVALGIPEERLPGEARG